MLSIFDRSFENSLSRREFLRVGSLALGGLALPGLLASRGAANPALRRAVKDKSVVMLFLQGGPPQIETFDPKMNAADTRARSITGEVQTSLPGATFGGTFPKLARHAHRTAVVRNFSVGRGGPSHERGYELVLAGGETIGATMGSIYARAAGSTHLTTGMPNNAIILPEAVDPGIQLGGPSGAFTLQQTLRYLASAGGLGTPYAPFNPSGGGQLLSNLQLRLTRQEFDDRRRLLSQLDSLQRQLDATGELTGADQFQQQAYEVLMRGVAQAFDLRREDPRVIAAYDTSNMVPISDIRRGGSRYRNNFNRSTNLLGKQMLMARRLCEAGCGFVTVVDSCWDFHNDGNNPPVQEGFDVLGPQADHAIAAFLSDVEARGLSDKILLIVTAEFGRTRPDARGGTGHWGELCPLLLAGGGLRMGQVIGASDRTGLRAAGDPYTPQHLLATVMHTLFDIGEVRVTPDLPRNILATITNGRPIPELI
jgi:uncharacterized protein (DUF1501 family)